MQSENSTAVAKVMKENMYKTSVDKNKASLLLLSAGLNLLRLALFTFFVF